MSKWTLIASNILSTFFRLWIKVVKLRLVLTSCHLDCLSWQRLFCEHKRAQPAVFFSSSLQTAAATALEPHCPSARLQTSLRSPKWWRSDYLCLWKREKYFFKSRLWKSATSSLDLAKWPTFKVDFASKVDFWVRIGWRICQSRAEKKKKNLQSRLWFPYRAGLNIFCIFVKEERINNNDLSTYIE